MPNSNIYLISPPKIDVESFSAKLDQALSTNKITKFQLRLKNISYADVKLAALKLQKICHKYQVPFILNDNVKLALEIKADGVHLGGDDGDILKIKKLTPKNFIIGSSCYDNKDRIKIAINANVDYISLGAFFKSKTKKSPGKPGFELIKWCKNQTNIPIICIGGINNNNFKDLFQNGANEIAVISYIWEHEDGVKDAINSLAYKSYA